MADTMKHLEDSYATKEDFNRLEFELSNISAKLDNYATKEDLTRVESDLSHKINKIDSKIDSLQSSNKDNLHKLEVDLYNKIDFKVDNLRTEFKEEMKAMTNKLYFGFAFITFVISMLKIFH